MIAILVPVKDVYVKLIFLEHFYFEPSVPYWKGKLYKQKIWLKLEKKVLAMHCHYFDRWNIVATD